MSRIILAAVAGAAAGWSAGYGLARRTSRLALGARLCGTPGRERASLSQMSDAIAEALQPGESVTYLSASARDQRNRLAVYAVSAADWKAHLTWRGDMPDDASALEGP